MKKVLLLVSLFSACYLLQAQTSFTNDSIQYICARDYWFSNMPPSRATILRSDTIDLLHQIISLNVTDFAKQNISGNSHVQFKSKMNNTSLLVMDLLDLAVDSVFQNGQKVSYTYDSVTVAISLANTLQQGDSAAVTIYYHGHPQADNATFGGFYFQNGYAYDLGVGSNYYPHMLGRAWHPCFDNFVERSTYEYYITTTSNKRAQCNGELMDTVTVGGNIVWHWKLRGTIPSYLANVSVGAYAPVTMTLNGLNGPLAAVIACAPNDSNLIKGSFVHLPNAFAAFEAHYGPYPWTRVGYAMVPSAKIAMEHATNISYPMTVITGTTLYENLYVHELSHQWFGDLVTPRTAEDYWLKEGWAVFSEKLFMEAMYGHQRYLDEVANIHELTLHFSHIYDGGYLPVSPVPQQYTYGKTVYDKSSDMAHVMQTYLGDSMFFHCLKNYFHDNAYTDQDSRSFRDYMSNCSGTDLTDYFNDWIFSPGFAHFSVDSFTVHQNPTITESDDYEVTVDIRQRLDHAPHYFHNVPIEITFMSSSFDTITKRTYISGSCTEYKTHLPFNPVFVCTDLAEKLQDAITENYHRISAKGTYAYTFGKMSVVVDSIIDSAFVRIEHNFVAPDAMKTAVPGLHLSQERYWRVDGILPQTFNANATLNYGGYVPGSPSESQNYYLDSKLITNVEDSLVLMYRRGVADDWQIDTGTTFDFQNSHTDKIGAIQIHHLKLGEYALAIYQSDKVDSVLTLPPADTCFVYVIPTGIHNVNTSNNEFAVYPNPAHHNFTLQGNLPANGELEVYNINGQRIYYRSLSSGPVNELVETGEWGNGVFVLRVSDAGNREVTTKKIVVIKEE